MISKFYIGVKLMALGARMCLKSDVEKEAFKNAINRNTTLGSMIESGDHIRGELFPMCDYDTQSVVNVLSQELLLEDYSELNNCSVKENYYKEKWNLH